MLSNRLIQKAKKAAYRGIRYHWLIERAQDQLRRHPILNIKEINLQVEVRPDDVIIDCGANVGDVTSQFARTGATVYAFEPNPLCFSILSRRFRLMRNVHCFNQGVADRHCKLTLNTPNAHGQWDAIETTVGASFVQDPVEPQSYTIQKSDIECIDLDEFVRSLGCRIRLLKVDIEGFELPVVNRLINTGTIHMIDLVVVETHEKQMPRLLRATEALRERIIHEGLEAKIRLDWY